MESTAISALVRMNLQGSTARLPSMDAYLIHVKTVAIAQTNTTATFVLVKMDLWEKTVRLTSTSACPVRVRTMATARTETTATSVLVKMDLWEITARPAPTTTSATFHHVRITASADIKRSPDCTHATAV
jgi:ABC-type histidine transport system ATPase subunit